MQPKYLPHIASSCELSRVGGSALLGLERLGERALEVYHWLYLSAAVPLIFFFATVQPPFSAPDEWAHFGRAPTFSRVAR